MKLLQCILLINLALLTVGAIAQAASPDAGTEFFENKIRPILADNCLRCHSAAAGKTKGGLALDSRQGVLRGGKDGVVIVPGEPDKSKLILAVRQTDPDLKMPEQGRLTDQQIADLTQWVKLGTPDPRDEKNIAKTAGSTDARAHWAFQPVKNPPIPQVKQKDWVRTPIDAFILAALESKGMSPNLPADKPTLLRRATFDLIGMPPTTQELAAFLADDSEGAFARVVDRLLASPHYGERWGRHWLDTARYSDTGGDIREESSAGRRLPYAAAYRDYVIEAFNADKPYDQFILEQLAADKLPMGSDDSSLAALGFLTVGERFVLANDVINERIDSVSKGFLGLTVTCARCHDHKFDPIPTADYYSLYGIFNSITEPRVKPVIGKSNAKTADYLAKVAALEQENRDLYYGAISKYGAMFRQRAGSYMLAGRYYLERARTPDMVAQRKQAVKKYQVDADFFEAGGGDWVRHHSASDPVWGPLVRFVGLAPQEFATRGKSLVAQVAANEGRQYNARVCALFKGDAPVSMEDVEQRYNRLFTEINASASAYVAAAAKPSATDRDLADFDPALRQLLDIPLPVAPASDVSIALLPDRTRGWPILVRAKVPFLSIGKQKNWLDLTHPGAPRTAGVVQDVPNPKDSHIFIRGQAQVLGPIVPRRFLEILSGPDRPVFRDGSGRLELARAIASRSNPLTARVAVNRIWMHHFGEGFVPTPDDLGVQSEKPSHPELIDWLATQFMESGWSFKKIHRLIMLSSVYQQSSKTNATYAELDSNNRLLWRANIRRLEFEALRDSLLLFSGSLDPAVGGQSINLTDEPYSFRRSVYGYVDRIELPELLQQFDFSDPRMPTSKRATTIVPPQSLFLMNSSMVVDVTRRIIARPEFASQHDNVGRVAALYKVIFQRQPSAQEVQIGLTYVSGIKPASVAPSDNIASPSGHGHQQGGGHHGRIDRGAVENEGQFVDRRPLTVWELYAQALLFSNEIAFVK